ncbi:fluoride efflux transporter CrcB [Bacillus weihaiensis]|uniref:Fluoride-specific ion channel FluC n=1 Tax=Bacillus weihaiensis TaxID=1547283 RepID=A0A1L3MT27_9BACI|nr:fluoride efflux transporter CrcB [Bacillus weihaiensis]APH05486.1 hypothetical protein A9C19_12380 [Bacillus weihaiensis]
MISVAVGGACGAALRYLVGECIALYWQKAFPIALILINCLGAFFLGLIIQYADDSLLILMATGFCGGFTTYSSFSMEAVSLLRSKKYLFFISYILLTIMGSILAYVCGEIVSSFFYR